MNAPLSTALCSVQRRQNNQIRKDTEFNSKTYSDFELFSYSVSLCVSIKDSERLGRICRTHFTLLKMSENVPNDLNSPLFSHLCKNTAVVAYCNDITQ